MIFFMANCAVKLSDPTLIDAAGKRLFMMRSGAGMAFVQRISKFSVGSEQVRIEEEQMQQEIARRPGFWCG